MLFDLATMKAAVIVVVLAMACMAAATELGKHRLTLFSLTAAKRFLCLSRDCLQELFCAPNYST